MALARHLDPATSRSHRRQDVWTPFGFLYATLREKDSVHTALRLDVDKTVAYGKPNGLRRALRFDADKTVA